MKFFDKEFITFFEQLSRNNNKEWFFDNKNKYETFVKKPFEEFIQDIIYRIHEDDENLMLTPKEAIFRIYRDIRFSKDKTPYKTHASAIIRNSGRKNMTDPGIYLELNHQHLRFYSGIYEMSKDQIERVRMYISSNLNEFELLLKNKDFKKYFSTIRGEQHKRLSKEYKEIALKQPLIANKQFYFYAELAPEKIISNNLSTNLMKFYFAAKPMNTFLKKALK